MAMACTFAITYDITWIVGTALHGTILAVILTGTSVWNIPIQTICRFAMCTIIIFVSLGDERNLIFNCKEHNSPEFDDVHEHS